MLRFHWVLSIFVINCLVLMHEIMTLNWFILPTPPLQYIARKMQTLTNFCFLVVRCPHPSGTLDWVWVNVLDKYTGIADISKIKHNTIKLYVYYWGHVVCSPAQRGCFPLNNLRCQMIVVHEATQTGHITRLYQVMKRPSALSTSDYLEKEGY